MDLRRKEYIEYYSVRFRKYEGHPVYPNLFAAEKALYDAINNTPDLEAFGRVLRENNLPFACAKALVKDEETYRAEYYAKMQETVHERCSREILAILEKCKDVNEINSKVTEIRLRYNTEFALDAVFDDFLSDIETLERLEVYASSDIPAAIRPDVSRRAAEYESSLRESWREKTSDLQAQNPHWRFDYENIWQHRHRRLIPYSDSVLKKRIGQHKAITGL